MGKGWNTKSRWFKVLAISITLLGFLTAGSAFAQTSTMSSPENGSRLTKLPTFTWTNAEADDYWLYIGSSQGAYDYYSSWVSKDLSATVPGLPFDDRTIYIRLWTSHGGTWTYNDYSYIANGTGSTDISVITNPASSGTELPNPAVFEWTTVPGVLHYWLDIGSSQGAHDYYFSTEGTATTATVYGLPSNKTMYVRLYTRIGYFVAYHDYTYSTPTTLAVMTTPASNGIRLSKLQTFTWTDAGADGYWLYFGSTPGGYDYYSVDQGTNLSTTVPGLPFNNATIYVRLWTNKGGVWAYNDYNYVANGTGSTDLAVMTTPASNGASIAKDASFEWTSVAGVTRYWLDLGSSQGAYNYYSGDMGTNTTATVSGLPSNRTIYVRLYTRIDGFLAYQDYNYQTTGSGMIAPANNGDRLSRLQTFEWSNDGSDSYWLYIGSTLGGYNYYSVNQGANLSATVPGLPFDSSTVYVRLWTLHGTTWEYTDYNYIANGSGSTDLAVMTTPASSGATISGSPTFEWTSVVGSPNYWLDIGSSQGAYNYYSGDQYSNTTGSVHGLPANTTVYVRLWTRIGLFQKYQDYTYQTANVVGMITPANSGDRLSRLQTFEWGNESADDYWLYIGSTQGSYNYYSVDVGTSLSATVPGLPFDSSTVYVRLWKLQGAAWTYRDYNYIANGSGTTDLAVMTTPANDGDTLGSPATFTWSSVTGTPNYWLQIGSSQGAYDYYTEDMYMNTTATVSGLPSGATVYVRLWTRFDPFKSYQDYTYMTP